LTRAGLASICAWRWISRSRKWSCSCGTAGRVVVLTCETVPYDRSARIRQLVTVCAGEHDDAGRRFPDEHEPFFERLIQRQAQMLASPAAGQSLTMSV